MNTSIGLGNPTWNLTLVLALLGSHALPEVVRESVVVSGQRGQGPDRSNGKWLAYTHAQNTCAAIAREQSQAMAMLHE